MKSLALLTLLPALAFAWQPRVSYVASPTGGLYGHGTVDMVVGHKRTTVYDFCALPQCADGAEPLPNLVTMEDGSLIGITSHGGASIYGVDGGVVFQLTPTNYGWESRVVYDFCSWWKHCAHYGHPMAYWIAHDDVLEGISMGKDGRGETWRFKLNYDGDNGQRWVPIQSWY